MAEYKTRKISKLKSRVLTPIGAGKGAAPEPAPTPAKQYVWQGQDVSQQEYEANVAKFFAEKPAQETTRRDFAEYGRARGFAEGGIEAQFAPETFAEKTQAWEQSMRGGRPSVEPSAWDVLKMGLMLPTGGAAAGKFVKFVPAMAGKGAVNTASAKLTGSLFSKIGVSLGGVAVLAAAVGTYPFAKFELAEATDKLGIAMFRASQMQDWDKVEELSALIKEITNPDLTDQIISWIPFANIISAVEKNIEAARISAEAFDYLAGKEKERIEKGETVADGWEKIEADREADRIRIRKEDEEYYAKIAENKRIAKEEQRKEDAAYWDKIWREQQKRKEAERKANEEYWEVVRRKWQKAREEMQKSKLRFGLLR